MIKYRINDVDDFGVLNFDLIDILSLFRKTSDKVEWKCAFIEIESSPEKLSVISNYLEELNEEGMSKTSFEDLNLLARNITQTIDCNLLAQFQSSLVQIEAMDSSYWDITFRGDFFSDVAEKINRRFKKVMIVGDSPNSDN